MAARVGAKVGADWIVLGAVNRFREREGTSLGVEAPASVASPLARGIPETNSRAAVNANLQRVDGAIARRIPEKFWRSPRRIQR